MLEFCLESEIGKFGPTDWLRWWESIVRPGVELLTAPPQTKLHLTFNFFMAGLLVSEEVMFYCVSVKQPSLLSAMEPPPSYGSEKLYSL